MTRNPEPVDTTDLHGYAEQRPREAQELLQHLVRRLLANAQGVTGVSMETGGSIGMTGFSVRWQAPRAAWADISAAGPGACRGLQMPGSRMASRHPCWPRRAGSINGDPRDGHSLLTSIIVSLAAHAAALS
jgi:hypothetical protein